MTRGSRRAGCLIHGLVKQCFGCAGSHVGVAVIEPSPGAQIDGAAADIRWRPLVVKPVLMSGSSRRCDRYHCHTLLVCPGDFVRGALAAADRNQRPTLIEHAGNELLPGQVGVDRCPHAFVGHYRASAFSAEVNDQTGRVVGAFFASCAGNIAAGAPTGPAAEAGDCPMRFINEQARDRSTPRAYDFFLFGGRVLIETRTAGDEQVSRSGAEHEFGQKVRNFGVVVDFAYGDAAVLQIPICRW